MVSVTGALRGGLQLSRGRRYICRLSWIFSADWKRFEFCAPQRGFACLMVTSGSIASAGEYGCRTDSTAVACAGAALPESSRCSRWTVSGRHIRHHSWVFAREEVRSCGSFNNCSGLSRRAACPRFSPTRHNCKQQHWRVEENERMQPRNFVMGRTYTVTTSLANPTWPAASRAATSWEPQESERTGQTS